MKADYQVIDNFLDKEDFLKIKNLLESSNFPWYYQPIINNNHSEKDLNCYFTHLFYRLETGFSNFFDITKPVIDKLKIKSLIRVKANLYPRTLKIEKHKKHIDYDFKHKGAIYYVNTNDGKTILNNIEIDSIENRLLIFKAHLPHSSTSTTNFKKRININFNYF